MPGKQKNAKAKTQRKAAGEMEGVEEEKTGRPGLGAKGKSQSEAIKLIKLISRRSKYV